MEFLEYRKKIQEQKVYNKQEEREAGELSSFGTKPFKRGTWTFVPTIHSPSQALHHRPDWSADYWHQLHKKVHHVLLDKERQCVQPGKYKEPVKNGEVVFYSREQAQGYVTNVDRDSKEVRFVTVLEPGKSRAVKPSDQRIILD